MIILLTIFLTFIYQITWIKKINDFKLKNFYYIFSFLIVIGYMFLFDKIIEPINYSHIPYFLIFLVMTNLSIIDCKYYEISGKSYGFIIVPALSMIIFQKSLFWQPLLGFIIIFILFFLIDKIVGIEKIGGADVKLLLLLCLTIPYYDVFMLLFITFFIDTIIFIVKFIWYKLSNKKERIQIPMIIAINLAWIIVSNLPAQ